MAIIRAISTTLTAVQDSLKRQQKHRDLELVSDIDRVDGKVGQASYEEVGSTASTDLGVP